MRSPSGSVTVENFRGRLRIRLPRFLFGGSQVRFSLHLPDTAINRQAAEIKARQIELDIALGTFDPTLDKYKSSPAIAALSLIEIWDKYATYKAKELSATTIAKDYKKARNHITALPTQKLERAREIRSALTKKLTSDAARRCLVQINACCNWAVEELLITTNPFDKMRSPKKATKKAIDPFNPSEVALILEGFLGHPQGQYYLPFVKFLFATGCRPSEAIALTWGDISPDLTTITFSQAIVLGQRKSTKTNTLRKFPVNGSLHKILTQLKLNSLDSKQLVFPAPMGGRIDNHNLLTRVWTPILQQQGINHRPLYNTRHTFISRCLEQGIEVTQIARWVGNSAKTIWQHYAGLISTSDVPEML